MGLPDAAAGALTKKAKEIYGKLAEVAAMDAVSMEAAWADATLEEQNEALFQVTKQYMDSAGRDAEVLSFKEWCELHGIGAR